MADPAHDRRGHQHESGASGGDARRAEILTLLARVPLFQGMPARELERVTRVCRPVALEKGGTLCRIGDEGDSLFIIEEGELEVWGGSRADSLIGRLGRGEFVGEISLILRGPRTATVVAARPSRLLAIDRADVEADLLTHPAVLEHLSRALARRLGTMARGERVERPVTSVLVSAEAGLRGRTLLAQGLAAVLDQADDAGKTLLLNVGSRDVGGLALTTASEAGLDRLERAVERNAASATLALTVAGDGGDPGEQVAAVADKLGARFDWIVIDLAPDRGMTAAVEQVAHRVVEIVERPDARAARDRRTIQAVNLANDASPPVPLGSMEPFVFPYDERLDQTDLPTRASYLRGDPHGPFARPLHRLARKLRGTTVGLALGGGAAFGIAHVGVLKVLEEAGVPIDCIAGSSMGAIIGAGYATGIRPPEMLEIAGRIGTVWTTLSAVMDLTLSQPAILSGERMARVFRPFAGENKRFEDLVVPYRAVAADVETGDRVTIAEGELEPAYRASAAVPIVWPPIRVDGRALIDGSMVDPVPGEVVRDMGADICVAVNVVPKLRRGVRTVLAQGYHRLNRFNPLARVAGSQDLPSMFDVGMNTIQMLQYELGNYKAIAADVLINPRLEEFTWVEFYRALEIIERGAVAAEQAVPEIRAVLAARSASPTGP